MSEREASNENPMDSQEKRKILRGFRALLLAVWSITLCNGDEISRLSDVFDEKLAECQSEEEVVTLANQFGRHLVKLDESAERDALLEKAKGAVKSPADYLPKPEPKELQLRFGWDKYDGSQEALDEFSAQLGYGSSEVDKSRHDNIRFPTGGHYLMSRMEMVPLIGGLASAQNTRSATKDVRHPGWPCRAFTSTTYVGKFRYGGYQFNSLQLVMDQATQVVAVQVKNDGGVKAVSLGGRVVPGYYNFVSSRRKGNPDCRVLARCESDGKLRKIYTTLYSDGGEVLETCILFIPEPVAAICRKICNQS
ncbi:hypothetical protein [Haloferula sp. A504]|uniref:hypothetical protein n=1 Tax=Haloferula sp. A504 TaxID=3373601 RepID=UPI0031CA18A2|nr:hypothetical protein [Verrucomicrobiaceae bacterium E54]